jgi:hypothetical protein
VSDGIEPRSSERILAVARRIVVAILVIAIVGVLVELLLLEHFEDVWQLTPVVLLALGLLVVLWHARAQGTWSARMLRAVMILTVVSGVLGVLLHYRGNVEFELEQNPSVRRWALFREAMMGATPALAPGVMVQIGLLGLLYAFLPGTKMADVRMQNSEFRKDDSES